MPETQKVTDEQAETALHQLLHADTTDDGGENPVVQEEQAAAPAETPAEPTVDLSAEPTEQEAAPSDDVASLQARIKTLTDQQAADKQRAADIQAATQRRYAQSEQILRDRYLRKASVTDNALKILRSVRTESGVSEADVDRVIREMEGTMNPASASYVPPDRKSVV